MSDLAGKAKAIFLEAIENYAPEQWASYLDDSCAGDGSLRARVDKLLRIAVASCCPGAGLVRPGFVRLLTDDVS